MELILQIWGGSFYLGNKMCFAFSEPASVKRKRQLLIAGWLLYILGLPAWVVILTGQKDWIAASIEMGALPAMLLGLYSAYYAKSAQPLFQKLVSIFTYGAIVFGVSISFFYHQGLSEFSQCLEIGMVIGFIMGSYCLAKGQHSGWLFFMLMNLCTALLMWIQDHPLLMIQQLLSLSFVIYGFKQATRSKRMVKG